MQSEGFRTVVSPKVMFTKLTVTEHDSISLELLSFNKENIKTNDYSAMLNVRT